MPGPPPGLRLRDRAPSGPLVPLEPHRDEAFVHHVRADVPLRAVHPLLDLAQERVDQSLSATRTPDRKRRS